VVAELFEATNQEPLDSLAVALDEMVAAQLLVRRPAREQVVNAHQDAVPDRFLDLGYLRQLGR
jgi:hypothetical protein